MNVKSISAALNCLIRNVALTFVNDNQSLELATKAAVSRHGREAIVMYQWYSACVQPENRGIYTQSDSSKKSSRNIWSLAVVSVDQRY